MNALRVVRLPSEGRKRIMEIERVVSGDLNKTIEQCVNALMDVERKVASLKHELVQTLNAVPASRGVVAQAPISPANVLGMTPTVPTLATPQSVLGATVPQATSFGANPAFIFGQPTWIPQTSVQGMPVTVPSVPYQNYAGYANLPPNVLGWNAWNYLVPYGYNYSLPQGLPQALGYQHYQQALNYPVLREVLGANVLPSTIPTLAHRAPAFGTVGVQGYPYIW